MPESTNYKDCRLVILDGSKIEYSDDYQSKAVGKVLDDQLIRDTVDRFVDWIDKFGGAVEQRCKGEDLQILGLHLYNILFDNVIREDPETREQTSVRRCFERAYRIFEKDRENDTSLRLRVILTFSQKADDLAAYPWEFVRVPWKPKDFFLAGKKTELILTRFVPEAGVDKLDPEERPLKILIACSTPEELGTVNADDAVAYIKGLQKDGIVEVDSVEVPTLLNIEAKLNAMKPHIFHFIGHGQATKDKQPELALMREPNDIKEAQLLQSVSDKRDGKKIPEADWIGSGRFAEIFNLHRPRLVFLHACKSAATGYKFHSTARDLVKAKIPAVVAMQYEISNADANTFAQKFYQHLDEGKSVDEAVSQGRWELGIFPSGREWNDRGFGTPVLYLQGNGAVIAPRESTGNVSSKVPCPYPLCRGWVIPKRPFCSTCKKKIAPCPRCAEVMAVEEEFCDACGYKPDAGSQSVVSATQIRMSENQLQPGAALNPSEKMPKEGDAVEPKSTSVDIRAELTQ